MAKEINESYLSLRIPSNENDEKFISFSVKLKIFKAFNEELGIIGNNKKLIFLTISNVV